MNPVLIVIPILTVLMFDLGLELRPADFSLLRRSPRAVMVGLCGQIVLLPAVGLGLIWVFDIDPVMAVGLMLIACSPGGSSSNVFSALAGGDVALSVSLTALSSVITLITLPLILSFSVGSWIELPLGSLIGQNIVLALLPVFAGMAVRAKLPAAASGFMLCCAAWRFRRSCCLPPCFCGASPDHIGQFLHVGSGGVASAVSEHVRRRSLGGDLRSRICAAADVGDRGRHAELCAGHRSGFVAAGVCR